MSRGARLRPANAPARNVAREPLDGRVPIGPRLRARRQQLKMTLSEVASRTGLTKGFVSDVERDKASPSVASLLRICETLEIRIGDLFDVGASRSAVVRTTDRRPMRFGGVGVVNYVLSADLHGRMEAVLSELAPGATGGTELYSLAADEEFVFVLEGSVAIQVDERVLELDRGDAMTFDGRRPHTFWNVSDTEEARALFVFTPSPY